ncbi:hypothetical protein FDF86_01690 [Clostridium botulinum]|nr:hypothetical protein [Clostridium botulinum]
MDNEKVNDYREGEIRRADLNLRKEFLGLITKIYRIKSYIYEIQLINYHENYEFISKYFNNKIRPVTSDIHIVLDTPKSYYNVISNIDLNDITQNHEGIFLNKNMFESILISKFFRIDFNKISINHNNGFVVTVEVLNDISLNDELDIKSFIMDMKVGINKVEVNKISKPVDKKIYISDVGLACTDKKYVYSIRDSEFWFDNVEKIYKGELSRENIDIFDKNKSKCYLDFSVWDNVNINIRNNILLYDKIYISFPLESNMSNFLESQRIKKSDLIEMVERDKLAVLLPNTESRYDDKLLMELYSHNPKSIISKRGINALMAMYFCDLEKKYLSNFGDSIDELLYIYKDLRISNDKSKNLLAEQLVWPIKAKIDSYELLNSYSPMRLSSIGVNKFFDLIDDGSSKYKNMKFELTSNSNSIHIATALQATYFPFTTRGKDGRTYSDGQVANILGNILNTYQYCNPQQQSKINIYQKYMDLNPQYINLLSTDNTVNISEFLYSSEKYNTPEKLKDIIIKLDNMSESERNKRVSEINNTIVNLGKESKNALKTTGHYLLSGAGLIPGIGTGISIMSIIMDVVNNTNKAQMIKKKKEIDNIKKSIDNKKCDREFVDDVYYLDRISRIAKLKY